MSPFQSISDKWGAEYFSVNITGMPQFFNLSAIERDTGGLFNHRLNVSTQATHRFNSDLTENRDDIILAFLALILMFIIEAIVSAILLRTKGDIIGRFGFSVKLLIEIIRDFDFHRLFKPQLRNSRLEKVWNFKFIFVAIVILVFTLGLEVGILFLTSQEQISVYNTERTFRIRQALLPGWEEVRFHTRASLNRPCIATALLQVDSGRTKINGCVISDITENEFELFSPLDESKPVDVTITSELHEFGAEHGVKIGGDEAKYSARAFFSLDGDLDDTRIMREVGISPHEERQIEAIHMQYIAFLFTEHRITFNSPSTSLDRLNNLPFKHKKLEGREIVVVKIPDGDDVKARTRSYQTTVTGVIPGGSAALRMAQDVFRGLTAIKVSKADEKEDLFIGKGMKTQRGPVWQERGRVVNWLTMVILVLSASIVLISTRVWLRSVGIADVAGGWVRKAVGADMSARPIRFGDSVNSSFQVREVEGNEYSVRERLFEAGPRYSTA